MNRRWWRSIKKTFRDYLVPIIIVFLFLMFFINYILFWGDNNINEKQNFDVSWINISIADPINTSWEIILQNWNKVELKDNTTIYKWEKIKISKWDVKLSLEWVWDFVLNRLWELNYNVDWSFSLISSDLWVNLKTNFVIDMRFMKVSWGEGSIFSISQNEIASSAYVVSWILEVTSNSWQKTVLQKWEKIVLMRNMSNDTNIDLSSLKEQIDDYTKNDDFFIKNKWNYFLTSSSPNINEISSSWSDISNCSFNYIEFTSIRDEQEVLNDTIDIEWVINSELVKKIDINWYIASISWTNFVLKDYKITNKVENIVYRLYDDKSNLITKWFITLYYSKWLGIYNQTSNLAQVLNYEMLNSEEYKIISPTENPFITTESLVQIEWIVPYWKVEKILVNWFRLQKFIPYSSKWNYFANAEYQNLKPWVNIYNIKYIWPEDKLMYENNFVIIKK